MCKCEGLCVSVRVGEMCVQLKNQVQTFSKLRKQVLSLQERKKDRTRSKKERKRQELRGGDKGGV